ncbi:MAG: hypothetical protein AB7T49_01065 [Oligoflexales bacterium]
MAMRSRTGMFVLLLCLGGCKQSTEDADVMSVSDNSAPGNGSSQYASCMESGRSGDDCGLNYAKVFADCQAYAKTEHYQKNKGDASKIDAETPIETCCRVIKHDAQAKDEQECLYKVDPKVYPKTGVPNDGHNDDHGRVGPSPCELTQSC